MGGLCAHAQDGDGQDATCTDAFPKPTCGTTGYTSTQICAAGADKTLISVKPATTECAGPTDCTQAECCRKSTCALSSFNGTAACSAGANKTLTEAKATTTTCAGPECTQAECCSMKPPKKESLDSASSQSYSAVLIAAVMATVMFV